MFTDSEDEGRERRHRRPIREVNKRTRKVNAVRKGPEFGTHSNEASTSRYSSLHSYERKDMKGYGHEKAITQERPGIERIRRDHADEGRNAPRSERHRKHRLQRQLLVATDTAAKATGRVAAVASRLAVGSVSAGHLVVFVSIVVLAIVIAVA